MSKNGNEEKFKKLTKSFGMLEDYDLNPEIIEHKDDIVEFWSSLDNSKRKSFTIFELNVMLFLISNYYSKYMKVDKKRMVSFLTEVVKLKKREKAYKEIKV